MAGMDYRAKFADSIIKDQGKMTSQPGQRIAAIDVMRALTMFLMLFVNDIPALKGIPHWLGHARWDEDMLGFADTIFPTFLFCVGMSIPFAIEGRLRRGESQFSTLVHILLRSLALIVMGIFTMSAEEGGGIVGYHRFSYLAVIAFFLVWIDYRSWKVATWLHYVLRGLGIALLAGLVVWRDIHGDSMHTGWWGILGLIGWAYLFSSLLYLITRNRLGASLVAWAAVMILFVVDAMHVIPGEWLSSVALLPFFPGGWSCRAIVMAGLAASVVLRHFASCGHSRRLPAVFALVAAAMLLLGLAAHPHWIVSKIQGTPTWVFFCLAISFALMALIYWLTDICGKASWFAFLRTAGTATLTCYLIPYIWYPLRDQLGLYIPESLWHGLPGIIISLAYSYIVILIASLLVKVRIKVRL